jgi:hypothetical protein
VSWLEEKRQHLTHHYVAYENLSLNELETLVSDEYYFDLSNPEKYVACKTRDKKKHEATREMNRMHREAQIINDEMDFKKLQEDLFQTFDEHGVVQKGLQYFYGGIPIMDKQITQSTIEAEENKYKEAMVRLERLKVNND